MNIIHIEYYTCNNEYYIYSKFAKQIYGFDFSIILILNYNKFKFTLNILKL